MKDCKRPSWPIKVLIVTRWLMLAFSFFILSNIYFDLKDWGISLFDAFGDYRTKNFLFDSYITPAMIMTFIATLCIAIQKSIEKDLVCWIANWLKTINSRQRLIVRFVVIALSFIGGPVTMVLLAWWLIPLWLYIEFRYSGLKNAH